MTRSAVIVCLALLAGSCGDDGPTAPTAPDDNQVHEYVTLTGRWSGTFDGILFSGDGQAELVQNGTAVTGEWSAPVLPPSSVTTPPGAFLQPR